MRRWQAYASQTTLPSQTSWLGYIGKLWEGKILATCSFSDLLSGGLIVISCMCHHVVPLLYLQFYFRHSGTGCAGSV